MFQTEFCGSDYKLLISWDLQNRESYNFNTRFDNDQEVFYKLNQLYQNISKLSTEFVDCMKSVHGTSNAEKIQSHLHENVTFKIENLNAETYPDEVSALKQENENLKQEKEELNAKYENEIVALQSDFAQQSAKICDEQEEKMRILKEELENKYNLEMSELRTYFENKCTESLRQFTEESYQCSKDSDTDSYSETEIDENYEKLEKTSIDCATKNLQKILDKDLKNIKKAYMVEVERLKAEFKNKKDEEVNELKRNLELKYTAKFETLQSQLHGLLQDKVFEDSVKLVQNEVKSEYEAELNKLNDLSDNEFIVNVDKENDLIQKHEEELNRRDDEWRNHVESSLSDMAVESALKAVIKETKIKSQSCHCSPSKKNKFKETSRLLKQKYQQEIENIRNEYEIHIKSIDLRYDQEIKKLNDENYALIYQNKELLELNEKSAREIDKLKNRLQESVEFLHSSEETEIINKIRDELSKMKTQHDIEVSSLKEQKYVLEQTVEKLRNGNYDDNVRQNVLLSLENELKTLLQKEKEEENINWPSGLQNLEQLILDKYRNKLSDFDSSGERHVKKQLVLSTPNEEGQMEISVDSSHREESPDLETILKERDTLQKIIVTLYSACDEFRKYISQLDEERDLSLSSELAKIGIISASNLPFSEIFSNLNDTEKENLKKIQFPSNISEVMGCLDLDETTNITLDCNKSFNQSDLSCWFERLKNDAAAILCLTSGKKLETHMYSKVSAFTQTDVDGRQYEEVQKMMEVLQKEISLYEDQYAKAQENIDKLTQEVARLNDKINSLESLEGYGEGINSVPSERRLSNACTDNQLPIAYCSECDKVKDEAKRDKEDLQAQIEAANKQLKNLKQFLDHQTAEREFERDEFDKKIEILQEQLKEKERDLSSLNHCSTELNVLEQQLKELQIDYERTKITNNKLELELSTLLEKIDTFRERNQELESKLAEKSENAENVAIRLKDREEELEQLQHEYQNVRQELDSMRDDGVRQLETLQEQHEVSSALIKQIKIQLIEVEKAILCRTKELESNCVTVSSSTAVSSPSEDVSVCERIDRLRLLSPPGSDVSSSPIHLPVDLLSCLHEKLKKLYRAEEGVLKKVQDQQLELNRLSNMLDEIQLEKDTLQEKLDETTSKLAEAKIKLDNWQHHNNVARSEVSTKLSKTIESLQSEVETYKKSISQKDLKMKEMTKKISNLENYIKNMEKEFSDKAEKMQLANENLRKELYDSSQEIIKVNEMLAGHRKQDNFSLSAIVEHFLEEKNQRIEELESKLEMFKTLAEISNKSHSTEIESKGSSKSRVNFTETLDSCSDYSDHTRHAAVSDSIILPRNISISSTKKPLLTSANESLGMLPPVQELDEFIQSEIPVQKVTFKDDSVKVNLDDLSWTRVPNEMNIESTKIDLDNIEDLKSIYSNSSEIEKLAAKGFCSEVQMYKEQWEAEKKNHFSTLLQMRELNSNWEADKKLLKEAEVKYTEEKMALESKLKNLEWENASSKEQCNKFEQQVLVLSKDLELKKETIEELRKQISEMESLKNSLKEVEMKYQMELEQLKQKEQKVMELSTLLETEKIKTQELHDNYEKWFKAVVKERVAAQIKCEEYAQSLKNLNEELLMEKNKYDKLALVVDGFDQKLGNSNSLAADLKHERDEITRLNSVIEQLQIALEKAEKEIVDLKEKNMGNENVENENLVPSKMEGFNNTLKDLTEKVQKQVEIAALLDKNMMKSLECDSKTESFLGDLIGFSPVGGDLRHILFKVLHGGFEALNEQDKHILQVAYHAFDDTMPNKVIQFETNIRELSDTVKRLELELKGEKKNNKDLRDKNYEQQMEINRLETIHVYIEERNSSLLAKLDEYRNKITKLEIELTTEKTSRRQIEMTFDHYKKQSLEKLTQNKVKLEETMEQLNATSMENLKLKKDVELLKNKMESLIAELNSVKAITQYHSDSESELSRSLNPIKARLNEMEEKYAKLKHDYEKRRIELKSIKSNFHLERSNCKKLEVIVKELSLEKQKLEVQLMEKKAQMEDLNWQKQKIEDKLKAAELAEMKRRRVKISQEFARKEMEQFKELQRKLENECQEFQENIAKLMNELTTAKSNYKQVLAEAQKIFLRMLRAESSQRSLIYQKNYLVITLWEYEKKCIGIARNIARGSKHLNAYPRNERISVKQKFRSVVFCLISVQRMKILIGRRINNNLIKVKNYFFSHMPAIIENDDFFIAAKKSYPKELKKENVEKDDEIAFQNICQQFAILHEKYVIAKPE